MRFYENGPNIPDSLLTLQEEGNVVFLCGAGISIPAGLPSFSKLTVDVARKLGHYKTVEDIESGKNVESFDRIFRELSKIYGNENVNYEVTCQLALPKKTKLINHKNILELSKNHIGNPQIVTTNFDLLFEECDSKIFKHVPPNIPSIEFQNGFEGIVYLHGRLTQGSIKTSRNYILSSSEFGRAYLAEGWATKFIKDLQAKYCIVIVGYSGDDPPMRYLLDGLSELKSNEGTPPIYAFVSNDSNAIEAWREKNVTPIIYNDFDALWATINAWALKSKNKLKWQKSVLSLSQKSPKILKPHERGQVVNLVSNTEGAKLFSEQENPPPSEWLCVFDNWHRYTVHTDNPENRIYVLDDDPEYDSEVLKPNFKGSLGRNVLEVGFSDEGNTQKLQLGFWNAEIYGRLPTRLFHISKWITQIMEQPFTIWWAASKSRLNPYLISLLQNELERGVKNKEIRTFWRYFIETNRLSENKEYGYFDLVKNVKSNGWNANTYNQFRELYTPYLSLSKCDYKSVPKKNSRINLRNFIRQQIIVAKIYEEKLDITIEASHKLLPIIRAALERIVDLSNEFKIYLHNVNTLFPEKASSDRYYDDLERLFTMFVKLFDNLANNNLGLAKKEYMQWRGDDKTYFGKMRLYTLAKYNLLSPDEISNELVHLDEEIFWDSSSRRELLFALKENWLVIDGTTKQILLKRIIKGNSRPKRVNIKKFHEYKGYNACQMIGWLEKQNCEIPKNIKNKINKLKKQVNDWNEGCIDDAASSHDGISGMVVIDENPACLLSVPLSGIIKTASENTHHFWGELRETNPFLGLAKQFPNKAFAVLLYEYKRGNFVSGFFQTFLNNVGDNLSNRAINAISALMLKLNDDEFHQIISHAVNFYYRFRERGYYIKNKNSLAIIKRFIFALGISANEDVKSNIISNLNNKKNITDSEYSYSKSINSIGGQLSQILLSQFMFEDIKDKSQLISLIENLMRIKNDAGCHAVCIVFSNFDFLFHNQKNWALNFLMPMLDIKNQKSESAWHGICANNTALNDEAFLYVKDIFVEIIKNKSAIKLDEQCRNTLVQILVFRTNNVEDNKSLFGYEETRKILKNCSDEERQSVIGMVCNKYVKHEDWTNKIKPFILNGMPREKEFNTQGISKELVRMADKAEMDFPEIVETILPFLTKIDYMYDICFRYVKSNNNEGSRNFDIARKYPDKTLSLLETVVPEEAHLAPYGLNATLDAIAEGNPTLKRTTEWKRLKKIAG